MPKIFTDIESLEATNIQVGESVDISAPEPRPQDLTKFNRSQKEASWGTGDQQTRITEESGIIRPYVRVTASYTAETNDYTISVNAAGGTTVTLPSAPPKGKIYVIVRAGAGAITVGGTTVGAGFRAKTLQYTGSAWETISTDTIDTDT